jgi:hypothetical protein
VPPGWSGAIPANVVRVDAPTPYVWIIGRTKTDEPILAQMRWIGIERSKSFDLDKLDPATKTALETAPKDALALIAWRVSSLARVVNGWSMNTDTMGAYGDYYLEARDRHPAGLGANVPKDAIYPINLADDTGSRWMAPIAMSLHFESSAVPPVNAFWSVTLYDAEGYQVPNSLNRFAVSSWMPFKYDPDGSLDLYFQNASPGADKEANWLPAPKGPFNLTMRLYAPRTTSRLPRVTPPRG